MPAWQAERSTVNQRVQIGAESTSALGTPVAASKLLECFDWTFGINPEINDYTPTGHKYVNIREENEEWVDLTVGGTLDYNGLIYLLGGAMGATNVAVHGSSTTAKDWIYTPPVYGSIVPQTYTLQQGDTTRAHQTAYSLFNSFGYTLTRKEIKVSAKGITQPISDGITLTSSPTAVALAPIVGKHINVYLDSTSGGLGTTQLTKVLQVDYSFDGVYGPFWPLNRSNVGFTAHVDLTPKTTVKLKMEADSVGMAMLGYLQQGTTYYLRVQAQGNQIASDGPGAVYNTFQHDMAIKVGKPSPFSDDSGIFAIEWECVVVEDPSWGTGKAQTVTVTNLITAL